MKKKIDKKENLKLVSFFEISNRKQSILMIVSLMIILMTLFEMTLAHIVSDRYSIYAHVLTVVFSGILAAVFGYIILTIRGSSVKRIIHEFKARKKAEEDHRATLSLLDSTLDSIVEGILVVDLNGRVVKTNKRFTELWQIPNELLEAKDDTKLLDCVLGQLKEPEKFLAKVKELYNNPHEQSNDLIEFKDGRIFERNSSAHRMDENIVGRVWSFRDLTIRHQIEQKVRLFEKAVKSVNDSVYIVDLSFKVLYLNEAAQNLYGYSENEILGKSIRLFWSQKNPEGKFVEMVNETRKGGWKGELFNKRKDGTEFPIVLTTSIIKDDSGVPIALVGVAKDITISRRMETLNYALYRISESVHSTSNLDELFAKIHNIVKDLMLANNFYIALYDEKADLISFPYFIDEEDPPQPPKRPGRGCTEYVLRNGEPVIIDKELSDKLNRAGEVDLVGAPSEVWLGVPLKISGKTIGVMVVQDYKSEYTYGENEKEILMFVSEQTASAIEKKRNEEELKRYTLELQKGNELLEAQASELKSLNEQLIHSEKQLIELNQSKDKFFSIISHDLKSPFNSLLGFAGQLHKDFDDFEKDEIKEYIGYINDSSKNLYNLVLNLLNWALIQRGKEKFEPKTINVKDFLDQCISVLIGNALKKNITLTNNLDPTHLVTADADMLNSIIQNLISNAIKFTNYGGNISVFSKLNSDKVQISIKDDGVGMDEEALKKIFKIESKHSTTGTADEHGTGLGLILVKELVERNQGNIWVESEVGSGTTFSFTLPMN